MTEAIAGRLSGDKISLGLAALPELYEQSYFGRPRGKGLELSLVEAAYLLDRSRISVLSEGESLDFPASLEKGFEFRYVVYKDLRERGYYVQPGRRLPGLPPREAIPERARPSSMS